MSSDPAWLPLLLKMVATMSVVIGAASTAERAGPFFGALVACLPVSAGPAYVLLSLQAEDRFIAESALASAVAVAATVLYLVVYALAAPRTTIPATLALALGTWIGAAALIRLAHWSVPSAAALNLAVFLLALRLTAGVTADLPPARARRRWYDLAFTAAAVGALVATVVTLSARLGPALTGYAALAPVTFTSLALVVHPRLGGRVAAATMASAVRPMIGFFLALLALHALAVPLHAPLALLAALGTTLAWSGVLVLWRLRRMRA